MSALELPASTTRTAREAMLGRSSSCPSRTRAGAVRAARGGHGWWWSATGTARCPTGSARTGLLEQVDGVVTSADAGAAKPDRRIFERGLELAGARPEEACTSATRSRTTWRAPARWGSARSWWRATARPGGSGGGGLARRAARPTLRVRCRTAALRRMPERRPRGRGGTGRSAFMAGAVCRLHQRGHRLGGARRRRPVRLARRDRGGNGLLDGSLVGAALLFASFVRRPRRAGTSGCGARVLAGSWLGGARPRHVLRVRGGVLGGAAIRTSSRAWPRTWAPTRARSGWSRPGS